MRLANEAPATSVADFLRAGWSRIRFFSWWKAWKRPEHLLRVRETLSLGNRGQIAVVAYGDEQFLVGCTNTSIALLARLAAAEATPRERAQHRLREE